MRACVRVILQHETESTSQIWHVSDAYFEQHGLHRYTLHDVIIALKYHHLYPKKCNVGDVLSVQNDLSHRTWLCKRGYFENTTRPCLEKIAEAMHAWREHVINWDERHTGLSALWNHVAPFPLRHTVIWDGYPLPVWRPRKWEQEIAEDRIAARWLHSGKYGCTVFKGHVAIGFNGLIYAHVGPCLGVDHDSRLYSDSLHKYPLLPGEWGLGDLAYIGQERILCGIKGPMTEFDLAYNAFIAFYRARVERVIAKIKSHGWCKCTFRGSYRQLCALNEIAVVGTALELRRNFEYEGNLAFEVSGPWKHDFN